MVGGRLLVSPLVASDLKRLKKFISLLKDHLSDGWRLVVSPVTVCSAAARLRTVTSHGGLTRIVSQVVVTVKFL